MSFDLDGDVTAEVDGATVHLRASGRDVVLTTDRPAEVRHATNLGPRGLAPIAARLDDAGLTVTVRTHERDIVRLGAGINTITGRVIAGSRRVALGRGALPLIPRWMRIGAVAGVLIAVGYRVRRPA